MDDREYRVLRLAARQQGVISRAQALAEGMTERMIDGRLGRGAWSRLFPGVYRLEGAPRSWLQTVTAAASWAGRGAALSHQTAAALWGLARFGEAEPIHVTVGCFLPPPKGLITHQSKLTSRDVVVRRGFRVTSVFRTVLDLAATEPEAAVEAAVDSALAKKLMRTEELRRFVDRHRGHRGIRLLKRLLERYEGGDGPTESELESRVLETIDAAGLPRPERQRTVSLGGRKRRLDFRFPGTRVVIEADGFAWHANPISFEKDRQRTNALAARGYVVLHWTWAALEERPGELISELRRSLGIHERRAA